MLKYLRHNCSWFFFYVHRRYLVVRERVLWLLISWGTDLVLVVLAPAEFNSKGLLVSSARGSFRSNHHLLFRASFALSLHLTFVNFGYLFLCDALNIVVNLSSWPTWSVVKVARIMIVLLEKASLRMSWELLTL